MKIGSSTASIPNPTPLLFLITATALLLWPDAPGLTALIVAAAVMAPIAVFCLSYSAVGAIIALIVASAVPRLYVEIAGLKARPEHIICGVLCISILFLKRQRRRPVQWIWPDYLLMIYAALNIFSSWFMSIAPSQTIKWAVQQVLVILAYFFLRVLVEDRNGLRKAFMVLLSVGSATVAFGILCFYSNLILGTEVGVTLGQYGDIPATQGLQFEANILGSYSGALAVMMLVTYLYGRRRRFLAGFALAFAGMAISLSRGAVGATLIGLLVVAFFSVRKRFLTRKLLFSVVKATLCALLLVLPAVLSQYTERFSTVDISDPTADPNTLTRVVQVGSAFEEVLKHPVLGGGTSSFQLAFDWQSLGAEWEDQGWIANTEMRVLHDTGLIGLVVFSAFLVSLYRRSRKVLKFESNPELVALLASTVVYCIAFQATEGTLLAFTWVHLGLIGCAISGFSAPKTSYERGLDQTASG
ncbi:MAG TPA: O-antigen ligase family protein [Candidatus Dormibacteraeota bacterium]|jgi:oligosaccharide repeat unit polymerase|nr:O-antigen ligase family protein [Candidatus Dormibacteraeota bacterium]